MHVCGAVFRRQRHLWGSPKLAGGFPLAFLGAFLVPLT